MVDVSSNASSSSSDMDLLILDRRHKVSTGTVQLKPKDISL